MSIPTVTILIPTFNRSKLLRRCVESALAQTQPCEVVVVDHGSSDDTPAVAATFGERIRYIRRDLDHGVHFCWLDGLMNARGEFVHINFDDDYMQPSFIERCMELMGPDVGMVFTKVSLRDDASGQVVAELFDNFGSTGIHSAGFFMDKQSRGLVSPGATIIRRMDIIDALFVGKVPFSRFEYHGVGPDWLMTAMTTLKYPKVGFVDEPLAVFSSHPGSITVSAMQDEAKKLAFKRAYQESRRFYAMLWLAKRFRLDLLGDAALLLLRLKANLASCFRRLFRSKNP